MEKPLDYYLSNKLPYKDWKPEWKEYKNYIRRKKRNPNMMNLSEKERKELKRKTALQNIEKSHDKYNSLSEEEKRIWNQHKKESSWDKLTDEEKEEKIKKMNNGNKIFWENMTDDERFQFARMRWDNIDPDKQKSIINNLSEQSKLYFQSLSDDQIADQVKRMQDGYWKKYNSNNEFRASQNQKLQNNWLVFWSNLSEEKKNQLLEVRIQKANEARKRLWDQNQEFRDKQIEHLRSHCNDYINSLSEYQRKMNSERLNESLSRYLSKLSPEERNEILGHNKFNDKFETKFRESILNNSFYLQEEYEVKFDNLNYKIWDYAIFSKSDNKLVMLVDLDGSFYHGDNSDYNGLQSKEERDEKRSYFVPNKDVKIFVITERNFINLFEDMMKKLIENYDEYINNLFHEYRSIKFPYPLYSHMDLINSLKSLYSMKCDDKYHQNISLNTKIGDRLIYNFHHSIYHAHVKGKPSPYIAWYNDSLLMECIKNRILYRSILNPNKILQGFNICKIAPKVSVFSAGRAKLLIYRYLNMYNTIFDPFSGFSGRMLGAISLNKKYIGQDISGIHVKESNEIISFISQCKNIFPNFVKPTIKYQDILTSYGEYECLFTCPPYSDKEIWQGEIKDKRSCDDWIDICLNHFKCKTYLFVVDNTNRYKDYIVDNITNKSHFGKNNEYVIKIDK